MLIRRRLKQDIPRIVELEKQQIDSWTRADITQVHKDPSADTWVAERDDQIVGYVICVRDAISVEIVRLCVDTPFRRQGVGTLLVTKVKSSIDKDVSMEMVVDEDEVVTQLFLKRLGFTCVKDFKVDASLFHLFRSGWRFDIPPDLKYRMSKSDPK